MPAHGFGVAEIKFTSRPQQFYHPVDDDLLRFSVKIYQHISAKYYIKRSSHGPFAMEIKLIKADHIFYRINDLDLLLGDGGKAGILVDAIALINVFCSVNAEAGAA